ncbi:MAG: beta-ketoacyl synthase chain length factor [Bacteroidales bacterium]|jgi:hypothetical protein
MLDKKVYINSIAGISPSMAAKGFSNVGEPDYKEYIPDPGARRRMSRIIRMGVASALMCLKNSSINSLDGIITGTGWGCLSDTEKFLNSIFENSERMLNPTSFIQSTSNTIGAQVALLTGEKNYNNTFVHGGTSFEAAMIDALLKLQEDSCDNILVGGLDEITPTKSHLLGRMGVWRYSSPGEGSHFFIFSSAFRESSIAEVVNVETFSKEGFPAGYRFEFTQLDRILSGVDNIGELTSDAKVPIVNFKELCGEYPTSTAFALWLACDTFSKDHDINKILIVNKHLRDQLSLIFVKRAGL